MIVLGWNLFSIPLKPLLLFNWGEVYFTGAKRFYGC